MAKLEKALEEIKIYENNFRHPNLEKLEVSGLYDLFPENGTEYKIEKSWPEQWIFCGESGIYIFLDENLEIAYIGKANHFGNRFGSYFSSGVEKKCILIQNWKTIPRYVVTVAVPLTSKFENSSLEGYLLSKIVTTDNTAENKR
ncbi:GIY-YIG nuclease family protein [Lutibacter flavus]|uniref:GIY-YIG catalytic domain-containing protein n=1 Tax=Lutibacter flavus TaxID=691689 RepID=A0A238YYJ6_9FLAO|nr:GIY-YIG nuclease family protein [Lutibacter flavus]SNR75589.1 GIY-YIG catalytic domain-containing protein [Lutibacter flavus]